MSLVHFGLSATAVAASLSYFGLPAVSAGPSFYVCVIVCAHSSSRGAGANRSAVCLVLGVGLRCDSCCLFSLPLHGHFFTVR